MSTRRRTEEKKRHKSSKSRRRSSGHSSDSENELDNDEDQLRSYEPTSPAQWSHHRHSTTSSVANGRIRTASDAVASPSLTQAAAAAWRRRAPIDGLPPELLIHVFRQITDVQVLHTCLFVSSTWCQCAVELLWLKPVLQSQSQTALPSFLSIISPGFNPDAPDVNGERNFDSSEVLVDAQWQSVEGISRPTLPPAAAAGPSTIVEPLFPYARFVRRLNLSGVAEDLHDVHFACLAGCVRLERLTLTNCVHLTDASLSVISNMTNLVALDLTGVFDVTDATIVLVVNSSTSNRIQGINLEGCKKITDTGILAIAENCPLLRRIKLCELELITGNSVSALVKNCPLLIEIDLNACKGVGEIATRDIWTNCFQLRELRLAQCTLLGDAGFPIATRMASTTGGVETADGIKANGGIFGAPSYTPLSFNSLPPLLLSRPLYHLRQLDLMSLQISDEAVQGIVANAPKLRNLVLAKCSQLTDRAVRAISQLGRHLQFLHLGHASSITDASIITLVKSCTRLRYVDLACCTSLTDESVRALSTLPKLRRIGLVRVSNLTDRAVEYLALRAPSLERVHLSYCEHLTVPAIHVLLQHLDRLTHLSLTGVPAFRREELQEFRRHPPSNFNHVQIAQFCVYSGGGINMLRNYLKSNAHNLDQFGTAQGENGGGNGNNNQQAIPPFGDPQLSDTDEEENENRYLLDQGASAAMVSTNLDSLPQLHPLHLISRSQANAGSSRQAGSSSSSRNQPQSRGSNSRSQQLPLVPEAYAGFSESNPNNPVGGVTGLRRRGDTSTPSSGGGGSSMAGAVSNPIVGAFMHAQVQKAMLREQDEMNAASSNNRTRARTRTSEDATATAVGLATGNDGSRGMANSRAVTTTSAPTIGGLGRISGPTVEEDVRAGATSRVEARESTRDVSVSEPSMGDVKADASSACPHEDGPRPNSDAVNVSGNGNGSGSSTPLRNGPGINGGLSILVASPSLDDMMAAPATATPSELSRTSTPSPAPSGSGGRSSSARKGVKRKLKGFNAAAASLFKGKERKT